MKFLEAQKVSFLPQGKRFNVVGHSSLVPSFSIAVCQLFLDNLYVEGMELPFCSLLEQLCLNKRSWSQLSLGIKMMVKLNKHYDEEKEEKQLQYYKDLSTIFVEK